MNVDGARLLHHRSNAVYLLPHDQVVVRLAPATTLRWERAVTAIEVTRWLATQPAPIALAPTPGEQPVITADAVATFWPLRPTTPTPSPTDLATPLRHLHTLPPPPLTLPHYKPLHRLQEALTLDAQRRAPVLTKDDHAWLTDQTQAVRDAFATTEFPLGLGLVHADVHSENLVRDPTGWLLIDWDQACFGPRELDLIASLPDHFHTPEADRTAFRNAYGYNLTEWNGWRLLRDLAELHSLASYIRLSPNKPAAATELDIRLRSLRSGNRDVQWRAVS
ncbi:phosphotransferase family protein [Saccharothrix sp. NRRL B-16348]|uniref:phosphotransferase family protein n=1 Tax=Saccharothrix sp. NRRL B-16348 TaxID=1415542 RepID=UPI000A8849D4|nr:phosphotransferase [Saccharothrix sp. NRRL B-16348]